MALSKVLGPEPEGASGMQLAREWVSVKVEASGETKEQQQLALRKKIYRHKTSKRIRLLNVY